MAFVAFGAAVCWVDSAERADVDVHWFSAPWRFEFRRVDDWTGACGRAFGGDVAGRVWYYTLVSVCSDSQTSAMPFARIMRSCSAQIRLMASDGEVESGRFGCFGE
jgi:hypothetical protein